MSHAAVIDYQQVAVRCQSVCEATEKSLAGLEDEMAQIESDSSLLLNDRSEELKGSIMAERDSLLKQIRDIHSLADEAVKKGNRSRDRLVTLDVSATARNLANQANELTTSRLIEYRSLITTLLKEAFLEDERKRKERVTGMVTIDDATQKVLDSISDDVLRQFTYIAYTKDNTLVGDSLRKAGQQLMDESVTMTYEQRKEAEKEKIRRELEAMKIDRKQVDAIMETEGASAKEQLQNIRAAATEEIVGEKVRQKSIKIIMNAIQDRGFIVDKKNMRINRDTNEVTLVALKASGEKAEFRVFLDGKFIYDFRGYEGQACQKDIEPFMNDLEEVYGMHVTDTKEIWKNPDKISTMKYQTYKTNKNTD